jgi:hypothetical protein
MRSLLLRCIDYHYDTSLHDSPQFIPWSYYGSEIIQNGVKYI